MEAEESKIVKEYHYLGVRVNMEFTGDNMDILEETATKFEKLLNPDGYVVDGERYNSLVENFGLLGACELLPSANKIAELQADPRCSCHLTVAIACPVHTYPLTPSQAWKS